jgi:cytochrome c-type biogenesis protein CcmH
MIFFGWLLIVSSVVIPALIVFSRSEQLPLDIGSRLKLGKRNNAEAGLARPALLFQLRFFASAVRNYSRGPAGSLGLAAAVFLTIAGIGAATSYLSDPTRAIASEGDSDDALLSRLDNYARSIESKEPTAKTPDGKLLPDVNTMISRLAARLETSPADVQGWQMLGWSYFNLGQYEQAAQAYAKAVALNPNSADLKTAYEQAKSKASETAGADAASSAQPEAVAKEGVETAKQAEATPPHETNAAIRSMVDGLADRLESSPRDVEGWTRLMRSRVVLGEREVAATAFQKALDVFKDDSDASGKIEAMAIELGLKSD